MTPTYTRIEIEGTIYNIDEDTMRKAINWVRTYEPDMDEVFRHSYESEEKELLLYAKKQLELDPVYECPSDLIKEWADSWDEQELNELIDQEHYANWLERINMESDYHTDQI